MTNTPKTTLKFASALCATAFLVGCGGSGNYVVDETAPQTAETTIAEPAQTPQSAETVEIAGKTYSLAPERALFNGENLDGWTNADGAEPPTGWTVEDGVLRLTAPEGSGDLFTRDSFANFVFEFEFRFGKECNSGVKYKLARPNGKGWVGLEYQVQDDANVADGQVADRKIASVFDVLAANEVANIPAAPTEATPTGDFRRGKIVVCGKNVEHWLDGERVLAFEIGSETWNAAKAESKFKNQKTFGEVESSPILLQCHGYPVDYRNVKIRKILVD